MKAGRLATAGGDRLELAHDRGTMRAIEIATQTAHTAQIGELTDDQCAALLRTWADLGNRERRQALELHASIAPCGVGCRSGAKNWVSLTGALRTCSPALRRQRYSR